MQTLKTLSIGKVEVPDVADGKPTVLCFSFDKRFPQANERSEMALIKNRTFGWRLKCLSILKTSCKTSKQL